MTAAVEALLASRPVGVVDRLSPLVCRVLADNPSPFTYTGTQSHLVGRDDLAVIDPGPADSAHVERLIEAIAGRPVRAILCTHTHRDHSPASRELKALTGAPILGCAPIASSDDGAGVEAGFDPDYAPDRAMADGESIAGAGWTLTAVATPGHTSNHLCFALAEEDALFCGDHVMGWSTTVVIPSDGDMGAYMTSLERLLRREEGVYYPAHGPVIDDPRKVVRGLLGHRKMREAQILRLLGVAPHTIPEFVAAMYPGIEGLLRMAAGRSVLAHLLHLEARGLVEGPEEAPWTLAA